MTIEMLRAMLGWCSIINVGFLMFSSILLIAIRGTVSRIHGKMFNLDENYLSQAYFQWLAQYKIAIIVFNVVPYFALRIVG